MSLESIYYVGQTVAVVAILASLAAIWFQMRQSQKMARAAAQRELLLRVSEWTREFININADGDDLTRGLVEYETSNAASQNQVNKALSEFVFICESALNMHRDGFFSDGTWAGIEGATLALIRTPGGSQWWRYGQTFIGPEIVEHLQERLKDLDENFPSFIDFTPTMRKRLIELGDHKPSSNDGSQEQEAASCEDQP